MKLTIFSIFLCFFVLAGATPFGFGSIKRDIQVDTSDLIKSCKLGTERSEVATVFYARGSFSINFRPKGGSNRNAAFYTTANQLSVHYFERLEGKYKVFKRKNNKITVLPDIKEQYQKLSLVSPGNISNSSENLS